MKSGKEQIVNDEFVVVLKLRTMKP